MPPSWTLCQAVFIVWAVGSEGDMLPAEVGMPLGADHGGATFFMLETHYDNPQVHKGQSSEHEEPRRTHIDHVNSRDIKTHSGSSLRKLEMMTYKVAVLSETHPI